MYVSTCCNIPCDVSMLCLIMKHATWGNLAMAIIGTMNEAWLCHREHNCLHGTSVLACHRICACMRAGETMRALLVLLLHDTVL